MITVKIGDESRDIEFDLDKITVQEYRALFEAGATKDYEDGILCKITGLEPDDLLQMSLKDYKRVFQNFIKAARDPLSDPS